MPVSQLADTEIEALVTGVKYLPNDYRRHLSRMRPRPYSAQHEEAQIEIQSGDVGAFRVIVRKNRINPMDFSVILGYVPPEQFTLFRLRRYNGLHEHTNKLEVVTFRTFHIHYATQRYQEAGFDIDAYAEATDRYTTLDGALELLLDDCNFVRPDEERLQQKFL